MTSSSEGEILHVSQVIRERWKIKLKVGGGGFGEIYEAIDLQNHNEKVAIKVESSKATKQVLKMEVAVLRRLQGKKHACKFYGCGRNEKFNYLVMSLQGKNLADLRRETPKQAFSLSTSIRVAVQILNGIREIHSIGFLHRDIKPSNFAMGRTPQTQQTVYMLDFGLARQYLNAKGEMRSPRSAAGFRGTVRYAAVTAHKNKEMGRQDDLWSLFYMVTEFLQGCLPWRKIKDKDEVGRMKENVDMEALLEDCPQQLHDFAAHLRTLSYPDTPDYDLLERLLHQVISENNINMEEPYDWDIGYDNAPGKKANGNGSSRLRSHTTAMIRPNDDKNRGLETQAPITMGEDDDEEVTNGPMGQPMPTHDLSHEKQEKPKYKRHEFMKPKYGTVNLDVINAVNARLAAVEDNNDNGVEANFNLPTPAAIRHGNTVESSSSLRKQEKTKSNRSITLSIRHRRPPHTDTCAQADDYSGNNPRTALTLLSKWHGSFDDSAEDEHASAEKQKVEGRSAYGRVAPSDNGGGSLLTSPGMTSSTPSTNHLSPIIITRSRNPIRAITNHPKQRTHSCGAPPSSTSIITHFKNLVNSFNSNHRLSRTVSADEKPKPPPPPPEPVRMSPSVTSTRVVARVSAPTQEEEKEMRRQRRLRRRSSDINLTQVRMAAQQNREQAVTAQSPPSPNNILRMRDNGSDEHFRIPLEDNKPILFCRASTSLLNIFQ